MHQKIIFVNGFLFPGSYPGGQGYWLGANSSFVAGAQAFLGSQLSSYFTDIKHYALSHASDRIAAGWQYAEKHHTILTAGFLQDHCHFSFVTHSMGAAFAEGMITFLQEKECSIGTVIHINAFQAADIEVNSANSRKWYVVDYQNTNDPLINNPVYSKPGDIKNADLKIRQKSNKHYFNRHRDPIENENIWQLLNQSGTIHKKRL